MTLESIFKAMRWFLLSVAHLLGSGSIMVLWFSFYDGRGGSFAFVMLATATGIMLGLPEPPATPSGRRR